MVSEAPGRVRERSVTGVEGRFIGGGVEEVYGFLGGGGGKLHDPAAGVGVLIDEFWLFGEILVDGGDSAGEGGIDLGDGFDGFEGADLLAGVEAAEGFGEFDEDDVGELGLGVVGDTASDAVFACGSSFSPAMGACRMRVSHT